ncbi:MAG: pyruvate:ferredoxin (flavodoxin) oxidoreductase [Bacteroidales bacterium]|jgi:pyruvate-ferredoxin/flavodoxin oxidoreductase|nr:pyruvate:ferredoxin (flavodoxin) oxidoreductase [Bacteroidales bacterium]
MTKEKKFLTCDGNQAAAHVAYMFSECAAIYPITPSSPMAEYVDEWSANGRKNIFGETVKLVEMQSEAGAAGALHGALQAGALSSTFTASQGLLLMIPNLYKIAGELLPGVLHVTARTIAAQALSIFGDHSDIYACRQTGFAMLASSSVQEAMDLAGVAHLSAIKGRVPFMHFFDGFRTSHEIQKIEALSNEDMAGLIDKKALKEYRDNALNPEHPVTRGTAQNPDVFFQAREASNVFYDKVADIVADYMQEVGKITGRVHKPFEYYGPKDAENIIIAMGSVTDTIKEVIDYLEEKGEKVGLVTVHLYRPFSIKYLGQELPQTTKRICVLDRTKEAGANGEPLYLDVVEAFSSCKDIPMDKKPMIIGGRYGLSSKDTTPAQIISVIENLKKETPKNQFTVGIVDDVTFHSLDVIPEISMAKQGTFEAKFYGLGADGTVGANKNSIKIIGDNTDKYCQAYFAYDSKKSGGFTCSHLRFGNTPIRSPYLVTTPDFVACHVFAYLNMYEILKGIKPNGTFLLNSIYDKEETIKNLPNKIKKELAEKNINFYIIDATKIAEEIGLGNRTNTILQSAFFKIADVIPYDLAVTQMKKAIDKSYGKKGENIVKMNYAAVDRGADVIKIEILPEWKNLDENISFTSTSTNNRPEFIKNVVDVINAQEGDSLPVSAFVGRENGTFPNGTSQYEKRGIATSVPEWVSDNCIQCNQCSYVCPHAAIRPFLINSEEMQKLPSDTKTLKAIGKEFEGLQFRIQVSVLDCTGCGNCADICPAKTKALEMKPLTTQMQEAKRWDSITENVSYKSSLVDKTKNVKNSQFAKPLFEFSGACAGCGETPYIKLATQLFGERMMIANATGCSSIYGGSCPSMPYTTNKEGKGPAWANSLFEDNAEFGLGMAIATRKMRDRVENLMKDGLVCQCCTEEQKQLYRLWLDNREDAQITQEVYDKLIDSISKCDCDVCKGLYENRQYIVKKSQWIIGGDGWAYDIGYGGLDHVIASGENVNILVLDTEVYSNTGGQASKATPVGAIAKFAASGKRIRKKDLGMIATTYGYVYVAQVSIGANQAQYLKVLKEAEAYNGPSLIIAYAPCINHGLKLGMGKTQEEGKRAVECGYWHLWRYNPQMAENGENPFVLDSKEPNWDKFQEFIDSEVRYNSLKKAFPEEASELFRLAQENALWRYNSYKRMAEENWSK